MGHKIKKFELELFTYIYFKLFFNNFRKKVVLDGWSSMRVAAKHDTKQTTISPLDGLVLQQTGAFHLHWLDGHGAQPPEITNNPLRDNKTLTRPIRCVFPVCPPFSPLSISPPNAYEPTVWRDCNPSGLHCKLLWKWISTAEVCLPFVRFIYYNRCQELWKFWRTPFSCEALQITWWRDF